jgi:serine/threonine protein phosphatase PrpC
MTSARQVCEDLLQDALDGGGRDNITIVVGRALPSDRPANGDGQMRRNLHGAYR